MLRHPHIETATSRLALQVGRLKGSPIALRARREAALAEAPLRASFTAAKLNVREVAQAGQALQSLTGPVSMAQVLTLLPPKLAAYIVQSQSKALMQMLLAWGASLREQAVLDKKANRRRQARSQVIKGHEHAHQTARIAAERQLRAAQAQAAMARGVQLAAGSNDLPVADRGDSRQDGMFSGASSASHWMVHALSVPLPTGVDLLKGVVRLRTQA